jgi:hypothetical protein
MLGDSQLARLVRYPSLVSKDVVNRAVGGAIAPEMIAQLGDLDPRDFDVVFIGVGTNDAGSRPVPLPDFLSAIRAVLDRCDGRRVVFVTTPGATAGAVGYDDAHMRRYADEAAALVRSVGGSVVDTRRVIAPLGRFGYFPDGIHISKPAHALYLPALRRAARRTARSAAAVV